MKILTTYLSIVLFLASTLLSSCSKESEKPDTKDTDTAGVSTETITINSVDRAYLLYLPATYDDSSNLPLMLNFHGFGGTANEHLSWTDMRPIADTANFIVVYPQGSLLDGFSHWNGGLDTPENKSDAEDFAFVAALIDELATNYNIDEERVYACGYSNGSFFSYALACYLSDKIAAIGSVAGTMMGETLENCNPSHPTPMINLHGTSDGTVPYDGGQGLEAIDAVLSYWIDFNNTSMRPTTNSVNDSGTTIEHQVYADGDNGVSVEHYKVINGEHVWFDMNYEGVNTSQLIWNYVSRYDINGVR